MTKQLHSEISQSLVLKHLEQNTFNQMSHTERHN